LAFSRTEDRATGDFQDGVILAEFGYVYLDSLSEEEDEITQAAFSD
jgi:hypothetical protein